MLRILEEEFSFFPGTYVPVTFSRTKLLELITSPMTLPVKLESSWVIISFLNRYAALTNLKYETVVRLVGSKDLHAKELTVLPVTSLTNADAPNPFDPLSLVMNLFPTLKLSGDSITSTPSTLPLDTELIFKMVLEPLTNPSSVFSRLTFVGRFAWDKSEL